MLNYNRYTIIQLTRALGPSELDHLFDERANSIGALLMHLAAVDKWYYNDCFEGRDEWNRDEKTLWQPAMELGDSARKTIRGNDIGFYHEHLSSVRSQTLAALKEKNDEWLLAVDKKLARKGKLNNYWKWFHVCEHEANHRGQISWLRSRLPGAKGKSD